jgi:ribosomal protein L11 methyltransferase
MTNNKRWLELSIATTAELAEAISEAIFPYVEGGVAAEQLNTDDGAVDRWEEETATGPVIVHAYLPMDETLEGRRAKVEQAIAYLNMIQPIAQPTYQEIAQSDWAEAWKVAFKPLRIGRHIFVRPSWVEAQPEPGDVVLTLDPGLAFGTGLHPTTQLCAAALEERVQPGMRVLDVGSGSALLSILAARLGAREVLGVDIDEEAIRAGQSNTALNGVADRVTIDLGSYDRAVGVYDAVVANILAGVIVKMLDNKLAETGRLFIFSGILDTQAADVESAVQRAGLNVIERKQSADWVCLLCGHAP